MLYLCIKKKEIQLWHTQFIIQDMKEESFYNHNYYRNPQTGEIILDICDELYNCGTFYIVDENFTIIEYLGDCYMGDYKWNQEEDIELEYYS